MHPNLAPSAVEMPVRPSVPAPATMRRADRARRRPVTFGERHRAPSGNARVGYAGGLIAGALGGAAAEVRFRRPIPVGSELVLAPMPGGRVELRSGADVHAVGVRSSLTIDVPAACNAEVVACLWSPQADEVDARGHARVEDVWGALEAAQSRVNGVPTDSSAPRTLITRIDGPVVAGEPHVSMGWFIAREGRLVLAGGAVIAPDGQPCAISLQTVVAPKR